MLGCKCKHAKQQYQIDRDTLGCLISWTISKGLYLVFKQIISTSSKIRIFLKRHSSAASAF